MSRFPVLSCAANTRPCYSGNWSVKKNYANQCCGRTNSALLPAISEKKAISCNPHIVPLSCDNLKICGSFNQTHVSNTQYQLQHVVNTYYVTIDNCNRCALQGAWLNIVLRSIGCTETRGLTLFGGASCSFETNVKFLLPQACGCVDGELIVYEKCAVTGQGYSVQIPLIPVGRTIVTIVVTIDIPEGVCSLPCTILPAQINLRFIKWLCEKPHVVFQTSTLVGCQPESICCDIIDDYESEEYECPPESDDDDDSSSSEDCENECGAGNNSSIVVADQECVEEEQSCSSEEED